MAQQGRHVEAHSHTTLDDKLKLACLGEGRGGGMEGRGGK